MRFGNGRKYSRQEDGSFVPDDDPKSTANVLRCTSQSFRYDLRHWEVIHTTAGHDQSEKREAFTFRRDDAGSTYLRCLLEDDRRRFHVIAESGIASLDGPIELRLFPLPTGGTEIEGRLTHYPRWESTFDEEVTEEHLSATLGIPADRFYWFIDRLRLPNARGVVSLDMRVYKEQIALSFDDPWMSQDFAVEHKSTSNITQYDLYVIEGPGIPDDDEREPSPAIEMELPSKESQLTVTEKSAGSTVSIGQRAILIVAAILLLFFAFSGATSYGSDQRLATFNFLAAVACLYLASRRVPA